MGNYLFIEKISLVNEIRSSRIEWEINGCMIVLVIYIETNVFNSIDNESNAQCFQNMKMHKIHL